MKIDLGAALGRALEQTRAGDPMAATRSIQAALSGRPAAPEARPAQPPRDPAIEDAEIVEDRPGPAARPAAKTDRKPPAPSRRRPLRDVVDLLGKGMPGIDLSGKGMPGLDGLGKNMPGLDILGKGLPGNAKPVAVPDGATFERRTFANPAGQRDYRLYVPSTLPDGAQGLVVMLHGCTQNADDFALGTQMNAVAERHGLIVAYPEQTRGENAQGCWNWFRPGDQTAQGGEPEILAGLALALGAEFDVPKGRTFAAGLSAGGAMAAILGVTHPEIFAAVGVHSGLPHGAAQDVMSAFSAMRGGAGASGASAARSIVFHGTADQTVHPSNGDMLLQAASGPGTSTARSAGRAPSGKSYVRTVVSAPDGSHRAELWMIDSAGHAWSGGAAAGSYTDPAGPDASAQMVRFFLQLPDTDAPASA
ncbi:poly (3-hydroxybutyrate) depolymerase [Oceaniovalibus guishaninsula JLT2003]|uniref:Poly (3-hydroxybutyrate) depolymerase n=1 Tax=Oceaniovalibus guishaninsula JLT2003 TaxID=1231392 RepID=K2HAP0_9RHOB|nr:PHB depolymerase family esterase [Oceaniovalibus guishaninsula]EKE44583.1 poly (3-hydroxybutyrate) depolymerase [Oceaniovalibus guishaninsula JLT2003]